MPAGPAGQSLHKVLAAQRMISYIAAVMSLLQRHRLVGQIGC